MSITRKDIASICHEANRELCNVLGDYSQVPWDSAPAWQQNSSVEGVSAIIEGRVTSPEQSHENWLAGKEAEGWIYGPIKDPAKKQHPCMVEYADLPDDQKLKDELFFSIVYALKDFV